VVTWLLLPYGLALTLSVSAPPLVTGTLDTIHGGHCTLVGTVQPGEPFHQVTLTAWCPALTTFARPPEAAPALTAAHLLLQIDAESGDGRWRGDGTLGSGRLVQQPQRAL
jgi:hypothetical protein